MQLGLGYLSENLSVKEKVDYAVLADKFGVNSIWVAEHYYSRDAIVTCSAILANTKRITVGTSIINPYTRHPALLAMTCATLDEMSGGRFILGLGSAIPLWVEEQMRIPFGDPKTSLLEAHRIIRGLLDRTSTTYEGKRFSINNVNLGFDPASGRVQIHLAAVGELMMKTSAKVADGVILSSGSSPFYVKRAMQRVRVGLSEVGKKQFSTTCLLLCSLTKDKKKARDDLRPWLLLTLRRPGRPRKVFSEESVVRELEDAIASGDRKRSLAACSDDVVDALSVSGDADECIAGIQRYRRLGLTNLVLVPISFEKDLLVDLLRKMGQAGIT